MLQNVLGIIISEDPAVVIVKKTHGHNRNLFVLLLAKYDVLIKTIDFLIG